MKHVKIEQIKPTGEMINDIIKCGSKHIWEEMVSNAVSVTVDGTYTFHYDTTAEEIEQMKKYGFNIESEIRGNITYHRIK